MTAHADRPVTVVVECGTAPARSPALAASMTATNVTSAMPDPDECALRASALGGDDRAWDALIRRHNHRVVVALLARGARVDRARDIAQEAWIRLIEQQRRGQLRELVLPGLAVTQATFLLRDEARRGRWLLSERDPDAVDAPLRTRDPGISPEDRLLTSEQLARASRALASCHPTAQRVFRLVYDDPDRAHADVAREVGLSLQRVRQILCEVRKKLREAIEGDGHA